MEGCLVCLRRWQEGNARMRTLADEEMWTERVEGGEGGRSGRGPGRGGGGAPGRAEAPGVLITDLKRYFLIVGGFKRYAFLPPSLLFLFLRQVGANGQGPGPGNADSTRLLRQVSPPT